jgi:hypothetical protein
MAGESDAAAGGGMANSPLASSKSTSGKSARRSRSPSPGAPEDKSAVPVKPSPNCSSKLPKRKASSNSTASLSQPNGTEEVAFATKCLATAQAQSESCSDHLTAAALAYNTEYFRTSQDPSKSKFPKAPTNALILKQPIDKSAPNKNLKHPLGGNDGGAVAVVVAPTAQVPV